MGMIRCYNCMEVFDSDFEVCPHCGYVISSLPAVAYHLYPNTRLNDRYVIGTVLGHGGFGITYNAWDTNLNIHVAIKEFFPNGLVNRIPGTKDVIVLSGNKQEQYQTGLERFLDEAKNTVAFASHPNIVNVFGYFEENHTAYYVMEYLNGQSVSAYLKQWNGILLLDEALEITTSICDALTEIHKHDIIHRDINPGNIFLCENGIKLIDFGAARLSETEFEMTRSIVITPGYAPPEQYQSKSKQGPWTDIYALCATLYRMLTGKRPLESIDRMVDDQLEMPRALNPEIPEWLEHIIMNGMALNSTLRFKSAEELKQAIQNQQMQALPEERIKKRKKKRLLLFSGILAGAVAVSGAALGFFLTHRPMQIAEGTVLTVAVPEDQLGIYQSLYEDYFQPNYEEQFSVSFVSDAAENAPAVYQRAAYPDQKPADLQEFYDDVITPADYYLIPDLLAAHSDLDYVPTGFYSVMAYVSNTYAANCKTYSFAENQPVTEEWYASADFTGAICPEELSAKAGELVSQMQKPELLPEAEAVERFSLRNSDILIGTNAQNQQILDVCNQHQNADTTIALSYSVYPVYRDGKAQFCLGDQWCISASADTSERHAAEIWLQFLLAEGVQEIMFMSGGETLPAMPLNRADFEKYIAYKTIFGGFLEDAVQNYELENT